MIPILKVRDKNGNIIPIPAIQGPKGEKGDQGLPGEVANAPRVRVNSSTNFWEVSYDDGQSWESLGVKATGPQGDSAFAGVVEEGYEGTEEEFYQRLIQQVEMGPRFKFGSYVGDGASMKKLDFDFEPKALFVACDGMSFWWVKGVREVFFGYHATCYNDHEYSSDDYAEMKVMLSVTCKGNSISWTSSASHRVSVGMGSASCTTEFSGELCFTAKDKTYHYIAIW